MKRNAVENVLPAPAVLAWDISQARLSIRINANALNRLAAECSMEMSGGEKRQAHAGILFGQMIAGDSASIIVEDFQPLTGPSRAGGREPAVSRSALNELSRKWSAEHGKLMKVVGCYLTASSFTGNGENLQEKAFSCIPESIPFGMLLTGSMQNSVSGLFLVRSPEVPSDSRPVAAVNWNYSRVTGALPGREGQKALPAAEFVARQDGKATARPELPALAPGLRLSAGLGAAVLLFCGYLLWTSRPKTGPGPEKPQEQAEPAAILAQLKDGAIYINWGRNPPAGLPERGSVRIQDGPWRKDIPLDDIRRPGQIVYTARTDDVQVTLHAEARGDTVAGYVRILNALPDLSGTMPMIDINAAGDRLASKVTGALSSLRSSKSAPAMASAALRAATDDKTPAQTQPVPVSFPFNADLNLPARRIIDPPLSPLLQQPDLSLPVYRFAPTLLPPAPSFQPPGSPPAAVQPASGMAPAPPSNAAVPDAPLVVPIVPATPLKRVKPIIGINEKFDPEIVTVSVRVDSFGSVTEAHEISPLARNKELTSRALAAAKHWKFRPAQREGDSIPSDYTLQFRFTNHQR
jgi:hypothetical protein